MTAAWASSGLMVYFVVYAADNASFIVLRDLLVSGELKETMEIFGLGISNRDILLREGVPSYVWREVVMEVIDSSHFSCIVFS